MRNLLLTLSFRGSAYHGSQVQKNALSVTEVFQDALEKVLGVREDIKGASRTDAGVHATGYCISLKTKSAIPLDGLQKGLNACLPGDMAVIEIREVPLDFHARYSATGKEYRYLIHNAPLRDPLKDGLCLEYPYPLDASQLDRQAKDFVGEYDFSAFCCSGSSVGEDKVRSITHAGVTRQGDMVCVCVRGNGFLYHMVRIMVGTLLDIASGKLEEGCIPKLLAGRDRTKAGMTAPACGLYLHQVFYDNL